ncbi:MAG: DUF58 domain-containing protein [Lachnospiraceae bacterium]|jgi:uncharacterized protein (DUF58 family)|nr:DUF58 domain-containing protein [Lachnospiraceae bacterium]
MSIILIGLVAAALFYIQHRLYQHTWNKAVNVAIKFHDDAVRAGEQTTLTEVVENAKWLPLPALKVKFQCSCTLIFASDQSSKVSDMYYRNDLFSLMPYRRITRKHKITCSKRGYYGIKGIDLVSADLFLAREMVETRAGETWLHVFPKPLEIPELPVTLRELCGEATERRHLVTDPFAFRGIREYTPFDEVKTVNWKASAKAEDLKVNVYDYSAVSSVSLFVNVADSQMSGSVDNIEKALSIAAYLAEAFLTKGVNLSLYANGRDCLQKTTLCLEDCCDRRQLIQINKMLARLDLEQKPEPFACFSQHLKQQADRMLVVISPYWLDDFQEMLAGQDNQRDIVWLCPCRKEEDIKVRAGLQNRTLLITDEMTRMGNHTY